VCLLAQTFNYLHGGGGHFWAYLNWALGLLSNGCEVIWMETVEADDATLEAGLAQLKGYLRPYGLDAGVALVAERRPELPRAVATACLPFEAGRAAELLINFRYGLAPERVAAFRRSALVDIDPGLLQHWIAQGQLELAHHDVYFTIGEHVSSPGIEWRRARPCVSLAEWPVVAAPPGAPFTTISHWYANEWVHDNRTGATFDNSKRAGFAPYLELPSRVRAPLELALCLDMDDSEAVGLRARGWRVTHAHRVASDPDAYQEYVRRSAGEFAAVKPSCLRFGNAWISDRTVCFLASGKPAIVEHTGPSDTLPERAGLWRFHDLDEAAEMVESVRGDYPRQARLARQLAEEQFDAAQVTRRVLEAALA